jgi:hypothetical protein
MSSKGRPKAFGTLRRSAASHRGSGSSAKILATPPHRAHLSSNLSRQCLRRHYASMMQDGLQIAGTRGGRGRDVSPPRTHMHPLECVTCQWAEYSIPGWGARPFIFLARCRRASRENWQCRSIAPRSQVQCLLAVANRLNGTSRRASHQSPWKVFAM